MPITKSTPVATTIRTDPRPFSGRQQEVDIVATWGRESILITVADLDLDTQSTAWVSIEDARVLAAKLNVLIKRADRSKAS